MQLLCTGWLTFLHGNLGSKWRLSFLRTGCNGLDQMLGGGLPINQLSLLYGEAGTGKTILSTQFAVEAARKALKVFYVDSDQSFPVNRVQRLAGDSDLAERIVLFRPEDFREQVRVIESIENMLTRTPTLLVVDSITGLYRSMDGKSHRFFARDRELNRQLAHLHALTSRFVLWTLLSGQVHSAPSGREWLVEPVATRTVWHWSDLILRLRPTPRPGVKDCLLKKKDGRDVPGAHCSFRITEDGIGDA